MTLREEVRKEAGRPVHGAVEVLATRVRERHGEDVAGILLYGSCRKQECPDGIIDFYVLVDQFESLTRAERWLLRALPPNVYFLEETTPWGRFACKYTMISYDAFLRGVGRGWFLSYLWGRFSQPTTIVFARDRTLQTELAACLLTAVETFVGRAVSLLGERFTLQQLWRTGFAASYRTEMRSERAGKLARLYDDHASYLNAVASLVLTGQRTEAGDAVLRNPQPLVRRLLGRFGWLVRIPVGKGLSTVRIVKSWYTFDGALDYVAWKLARQSGQPIEIPERVRRKPALHVWGFLWRLYRAGVFR